MFRFSSALHKFRGLTPGQIKRDAMAGLSVAAVALPVGLAYAAMMEVPAVAGLWAAIVGMLAYALFGASRTLVVGPDTATCTLVAATLTSMALTTPEARLQAAAGLAILVGLGCLLARLLRLGLLANLLSRPVLVGYLSGVAITLAVSQVSALTGMSMHHDGSTSPLVEFWRSLRGIHWPTLVLGLLGIVGLVLVKRRYPRLPGPILLVGLTSLLSWLFKFPQMGIAVVGDVPGGLPMLALPAPVEHVDRLLLGAAGVLVVSFSSGIVTARSFAARVGEHVDPNRELVGFGAANLAAGLFQGFPVTGADSRTAVGQVAGGRSPLVSVAAALALLVVVVSLSTPLYWLPKATLAAILLMAAINLVDLGAFRQLVRVSRVELVFALLAAVGVVAFGVLQGVAISVGATLLYALYAAATPRDALLGRLPGERVLAKLHLNHEARPIPGVTVWLFESSIWFFNADAFRQRGMQVIAQAGDIRWFVLDAEAMTQADADAIQALTDLKHALDERGIGFIIGGGHGRFRLVLARAGLDDLIGRNRIFSSPELAVDAIERGLAGEPPDPARSMPCNVRARPFS